MKRNYKNAPYAKYFALMFICLYAKTLSAQMKENSLMTDKQTVKNITTKWWKEAVVYQIYPRSFKDSNGDGIGDLKGITGKLDYLMELGVNTLWICPFFDSPNEDNGYDIRNYREIMSDFGNMSDLDSLVKEMKKRNLRLIVDLVANHTSDEHRWFQESRKSKDNAYRDYYIWRPGESGGYPNDWVSWFSGSVWEKDNLTDEYYLHLFAKKQPDLNWENPKVRQEIYDIMQFWLDKGADGFRLDAIPFISKPQDFPNYPENYDGDFAKVYASGPRLHEFLKEMHEKVFSKGDVFTVGETSGIDLEDAPLFVDERRKELSTAFHFGTVGVDRQQNWWKWKPWKLSELKALFTRYEQVYDEHSWNSVFFSNHDNPRMLSRFGDDSEKHRVASAKLLGTCLLTLKGTPFIYQGDEIGMTNYPFTDISQFDDLAAKNAWQDEVVDRGDDPGGFMENLLKTSRDHARTPIQWDNTKNGGFTSGGNPWLAVNPNYGLINAENQLSDSRSVFNHYKRLISLRKSNLTLVYGDFKDLEPESESIFVYTRTLGEESFLVVLNFSDDSTHYTLPLSPKKMKIVLNNFEKVKTDKNTIEMMPWQALIYQIKS